MVVIDRIVNHLVVVEAIATEIGIVGIEDILIGSLLHHEAIARIGVVGREVEEEQEVTTTEGKYLVAIVVPNLNYALLLETLVFLENLEHCLVEVAEVMEAKILIVHEVPLATGIFVAPSVSFAREVDPFGMSELVAHEVEVASVYGAYCGQANHFVQSNAAVHIRVLVAFLEMPVHVAVYETEDDGLVAHERLVVAFAIGDGPLVTAAVCEFPQNAAWFPILITQLLDNLYPVVGDVHSQAVVEAIASILHREGESRHSAHLFRYGDGILVDAVNQLVGKGEIGNGVAILMAIVVVAIAHEALS